jgi:hypothetical protein|tara:strand:+ start:266 stop:403 length:138 start_codon:yes stop_codon:yes gene_type:complete
MDVLKGEEGKRVRLGEGRIVTVCPLFNQPTEKSSLGVIFDDDHDV